MIFFDESVLESDFILFCWKFTFVSIEFRFCFLQKIKFYDIWCFGTMYKWNAEHFLQLNLDWRLFFFQSQMKNRIIRRNILFIWDFLWEDLFLQNTEWFLFFGRRKKNIYLNMFINKSQSSAKLTSVTRLN